MADFKARSDAGSALSIAEKEHWAASLASFFQPKTAEEERRRPKKLFREDPRTSALLWIRALENAMVRGMRLSLSSFKVNWALLGRLLSEGGIVDGSELSQCAPVLSLSSDQGSNQFAALNFLVYKLQVNIATLWDPIAHRANNDINNAIREAKLTAVVFTATPLYNFRSGPWSSTAWDKAMTSVVQTLVQTLLPNDALLLKLWPMICAENGWTSSSQTDEAARARWIKDLPKLEQSQTRGEMVAATRWFSFQHRERELRSHWTENLLKFIYYGIVHGFVSRSWQVFKDAAACRGKRKFNVDEKVMDAQAGLCENDDSKGTKHDGLTTAAEGLTSIRQRCKNTLQVCLELASDPDLKSKTAIVGVITHAIAMEHGNDVKHMRSKEAVVAKYLGYAQGRWLDSLYACIGAARSLKELQQCGFVVRPGSVPKSLPLDDTRVVQEDAMAQVVMDLLLCVLKHRAKSMLHYSESYPGRLAGMLAPDTDKAKRMWGQIVSDIGVFEAARDCDWPQVAHMASRSPLAMPLMRVVARLAREHPDPFPVVRRYVMDIFSGLGQSVICENANHDIRDHEIRDQASRAVCRTRRWALVRQHELAGRRGRCEVEPNPQIQAPPRSQ